MDTNVIKSNRHGGAIACGRDSYGEIKIEVGNSRLEFKPVRLGPVHTMI